MILLFLFYFISFQFLLICLFSLRAPFFLSTSSSTSGEMGCVSKFWRQAGNVHRQTHSLEHQISVPLSPRVSARKGSQKGPRRLHWASCLLNAYISRRLPSQAAAKARRAIEPPNTMYVDQDVKIFEARHKARHNLHSQTLRFVALTPRTNDLQRLGRQSWNQKASWN